MEPTGHDMLCQVKSQSLPGVLVSEHIASPETHGCWDPPTRFTFTCLGAALRFMLLAGLEVPAAQGAVLPLLCSDPQSCSCAMWACAHARLSTWDALTSRYAMLSKRLKDTGISQEHARIFSLPQHFVLAWPSAHVSGTNKSFFPPLPTGALLHFTGEGSSSSHTTLLFGSFPDLWKILEHGIQGHDAFILWEGPLPSLPGIYQL